MRGEINLFNLGNFWGLTGGDLLIQLRFDIIFDHWESMTIPSNRVRSISFARTGFHGAGTLVLVERTLVRTDNDRFADCDRVAAIHSLGTQDFAESTA